MFQHTGLECPKTKNIHFLAFWNFIQIMAANSYFRFQTELGQGLLDVHLHQKAAAQTVGTDGKYFHGVLQKISTPGPGPKPRPAGLGRSPGPAQAIA